MQKESGFTLLELMTAIAIIAILMAIAAPPVLHWKADHELRNATDQVFSDMQKARLSAVRQDINMFVVFDRANGTYSLYKDTNFDNILEPGIDAKLSTAHLPPGISFSSVTLANDEVGFDGMGVANSTGDILIKGTQSGNNTQKISINALGTIQIGS